VIIPLCTYSIRTKNIQQIIFYTIIPSIIVPTFVAACYLETNADRFDTKPIAEKIAQFQTQNAVAFYVGKYHAQFQFTGRLTQPLTLLNSPEAVQLWTQEHSNGFVLFDSEKMARENLAYSHAYRAGELGFISSEKLLANWDSLKLPNP
jgi:hypothetical protein